MYEETSFPIMLLKSFNKQFSKEVFDELGKWFEFGIDNWAHADTLAMFILPEFLLKDIVKLEDFRPWLQSSQKFQRRVVPVSIIKLIKEKRNTDFKPYFNFIEPLMLDLEREVHQGTGWFLREAWKIRPIETEEFLLKWKNISARLIYQYACEKMSKEEKLRFKKEKQL
jgi:3-methyladenine DNA glycosylase AlkD